jgi:TolB-like protein
LSLWSEIRQRRITQFVVAYLAGGWMVLAVFDQVVDREVLPLVVYQVALTLFLFGIGGALIMGWYHGEKGEQQAPMTEIAMLALLAAAAVGASGVVVRNAVGDARLQDVLADDLREIGVLYLVDLSRDGSMQAVADGITEGLITTLSGVRELDVSSRNAAREARDLGDVGPDSIAAVLGVGTLIDGTVDQSGDEIQVSVRLLEGRSGAAMFRETFSWPVADVADIGSALAEEVANVLREQLGSEIRLREVEAAAPNAATWLQVARAERYIKDADQAVLDGDVDALIEALDAADSELASAQEAAPEWAEPLVLRSQVAHDWYILAGSTEELFETLELSVEYADAALALDPDNAAALERRGTALYRRYLTQADEDDVLDDLLVRAQSDLERAETLDPDRASANSTLSHLYYQIDDWVGAVLAARNAYEQDAFLDVADGVLWRLYTASYDLGNLEEAEESCLEGRRRFPQSFRFIQCQIFLMTMPGSTPDTDLAWALYDELQPLLTERPEYFAAQARTLIGGILGLAGLPDSADVVMREARLDAELDPDRELLAIEAAMRGGMGDVDGSIAALERFMLANDAHAPGEHWWWRNLAGNPDFERLRAEH